MDSDRSTAQATFCATLVDEWLRAGVSRAFVAPGSRSTPLALALAAADRIRVEVFHDERAAGFAALGAGLATGVPAVVLCTSGTAAAHLHAAVIEADLSCVPLLVCTADRPPELRDVGAPQTIDQTYLYGRAPRWFADPGVADAAVEASWRPLAARAVAMATGRPPGPVHLNLPFREPLVGDADPLPRPRADDGPWITAEAPQPVTLSIPPAARILVVGTSARSGSVVGGGWPVLADIGAGSGGADVVAHADPILRDAAVADRLVPELVVRVGRPPASRVVNEWLARTGATEWVVSERWSDPAGTAARVVPAPAVVELPPSDGTYRDAWRAADDAAEGAIVAGLDAYATATEPAVARAMVAGMPAGAHLVVASSMPVRDVEWYARRRADVHVHGNRGANGIDGTVATAVGVALATGEKTAVLMGDVAFLHDSTALVALGRRGIDLTIVVVDNDGGGIFSFLPQATALDQARFETLYGTPHGADLTTIAAAHGIAATVVADASALRPAIRAAVDAGGVSVVVVHTDRATNVVVHDELNAAVAKAVSAISPSA